MSVSTRLTYEEYKHLLPNSSSRFVVFDIETTGLDPEKEEIVELAAIEIQNKKKTRSFHQYAKPKRDMT